MRVSYLVNRIPWFGAHTGYEQLPRYVQAEGTETKLCTPHNTIFDRVLGKAVSMGRGHGRISQSDAAARWRLERTLRKPGTAGHILYGEEHVIFWRDVAPALRQRTILTLHQPAASPPWTPRRIQGLAGLPHAIVLWQKNIDWFREKTGGDVYFIPHGVDTEFFTPGQPAPGPARLLYVGVHLRNTRMLARVIDKLAGRDVEFDFLVPINRRSEAGLAELARNPRIRWHAGVDDETMRNLYRSARLLLLPMDDSGANTAVVEALACGLPVVTTDVGGIRDYGGGTLFPVVENNDDDGMVALIEKYLDQPGGRDEMSRACRAFAEAELSWPLAARRHLEIYRKALA
jgi:glycosyltransferase involved in cell wall biosynthesis